MAQNITIAGASYSNVPSIEVPKVGGGTASFIDVADMLPVNENLLENWNFSDPVNQRGQSSYSGGSVGSYCIDRWMRATVITVDVNADNVAVTNTASGGYALWQYLTNKLTIGVAYTISILYSTTASGNVMRLHDGSQYYCSVNLGVSSNKALVTTTYTHTGANQISRFEVRPANNGTITIYAVKIEQGTKQTLAHQENGAWVLNEIPNKSAQTLLCQTSTADVNDAYANKAVFPPNAITAGDTPVMIAAGAYPTTSTSLTEVARITITKAGTYRFKWVAYRTSSTGTFQSQLWKNGVAVSEAYSPSTTTWYGAYYEDVSCSVGDYVCVYARGRSSSYSIIISGFTACINGDNGF